MTEPSTTPVRLEVRKDGNLFIGDLVFTDNTVWMAWQVFRTLKALKQNTRATLFEGPIVRV